MASNPVLGEQPQLLHTEPPRKAPWWFLLSTVPPPFFMLMTLQRSPHESCRSGLQCQSGPSQVYPEINLSCELVLPPLFIFVLTGVVLQIHWFGPETVLLSNLFGLLILHLSGAPLCSSLVFWKKCRCNPTASSLSHILDTAVHLHDIKHTQTYKQTGYLRK